MDFAWPIITNTEVLAVHAAWPTTETTVGLPGGMVSTDGVHQDGTVKQITWQVWSKNVSSDSVAVLLINAGDVAQDVAVQFDGHMVPCRPRGLCNESHLAAICAPACPDGPNDAIAMTARDLWERKALPDVTDGRLVAKQLPPHDSLFALLTRRG